MSDIKWRNDGSGLGDADYLPDGVVMHDMVNRLPIKGAKAGQKEPRKPNISKDTAASISTAKLLYGLGEGEIYGLADGAKSIRLDGTPLVDDAGNPNFEGVTWDFRNGSNDQEYIKGFPDVSNETPINVELRSSQPWIKAFNDTQLSAVRVRFKWNRLSQTNSENGDVTGYKIDYAIDLQTDGGAYQTVLTTKIQDKTSAGYERTHRIDLPKAKTGWQLRVRRITPNSTSDLIQDTMMIDAVAEVIDVKLSYPNTALLGVQYNAELFSNVAKMSVRLKGKIIRVPDNYDPVARTYTGIWTGNFKDAYSNNPAWIFYDLCTQWRGGLGERLDATMIDRWSLYALGQYCDQPVSDGQGGLEPRFTCNVYLQKQEEAYTVLQNIAGIFRAMSFWTGERIMLDADVPQDPIYTYSSANIVGGVAGIQYSGTRNRDRHTLAKVAWDNPNNDYQTEYEYVRDEKAMSKFGVKVLDLSAFGCTSQAQAQRAGLWALKTEQLETRQVTFSVGLDGAIPTVGNIISLSDEAFAGRANGGRVSTVNSTQRIIELDREVVAAAGDVLIINGGSGKSERRNISNVVGNRITVTAGFTSAEPEHVWAIETADLKLMRFRVMSIIENDDATYAITGIQHEPQKYDAIDFGTDVKPTDITIINPDTVDAPASVAITSRHREVQGQTVTTLIISWSQVKGAVAYDVEWRKDDGTWIKLPRTGNVSVEIVGVYSGNYLARVRAISAFDVQSQATTSTLTAVEGKIGLPPTIVGLTATGVLFGMDLKWGFQQGSGDAAYTEIQVGSAPNVNVATLGQYSYPTNTHTINGLQGNLSQSYRARLVDKLGFKSPWSAWVTGTTDANADKIMDLIQGQIDESAFSNIMKGRIADIEINKEAISQEVLDRIAAITAANDRITDEAADRVEAVRLLSEGQANIEDNALALVEAINTERQERVDALVDIGDEIFLEQKERIEAMRLASLKADELQEFADNLAEDVDAVVVSQTKTDEGVAAIKEKQSTFEIENGLQAEKLTYLSSQIDFDYADKTQFANSARSTAWTFAKTIAHADYTNAQMVRGLSADYKDSSAKFTESIELNASAIESLATKTTTLSAETDNNKADILAEITARSDAVEAVSSDILLLVAKTEDNEAAVTKETEARTTALDAVAEDITTLTAKTGENEAAVKEESRVRTEEDSALSERIVTLTAKTGDNEAAIQQESEARTTAIDSVARDVTTLVSKTEDNEAAITRESETRTTDFEALVSDIEVVSSKTDGNTANITALDETLTTEISAQAQTLKFLSSEVSLGYADSNKYADKSRATVWTFAKTVAHADYTNAQLITGLSADHKDSSARFTENIELLATKNEAAATKTTNLSAQIVGGYDGNDLTELNSGLIFEESKARASDVEGLAEQISLLSAGVGEQFDSFDIWHFNKDKDGWTGGVFSDGWIDVETETITSPTVEDLDGAAYKHIKLRIKKVGTPTWQGLLSYTGGSKTIAEPSYDEDGIALVNWQMEWSGDITSFSLKLASAGDNLNYYSIDWIAVGRPSPGASNASLLRESKVRASETSANASDLVALRSKIEGGNGVPIESSITKKLETTANLASTTAEDLTKLTSTYEDEMYGYEGTVQTTARTLASATQAEAERLDLLSANVLPSYADKTQYASSTRSTQWTYAKTVAADNYAANQRITNLQSEFADSNANFTNELFTLATRDKSIAADISQLYAETGANYGLIQDVSIAISTPNTGLAAKVTELQSSAQINAGAASSAQQAADAAATAAGNKGEVIYGSTEPTEAQQKAQNLWIDTSGGNNTPKRWSGSAWLSVTDKAATDAAAAASAAQGTANSALTAAQAAQQAATASAVKLAEISADNKLTPTEKKQLKTIWEEIKKTDASIREQAEKYSVSTASYDYVYTALTDYLTPLMGNMGQTNTIVRDTFDGRFANLYERRAELYAAITSATEQATRLATEQAATARQAAEAAEGKAQKAKEDLSDIYADGKVTPSEKQQIKTIWTEIVETDVEVRANAAKYNINLGSYPTAYTTLENHVNALLLDMGTTINVDRDTFDGRFETYYKRRADVNRNIVTAAEKQAADAARAASAAQGTANGAQGAAEAAQQAANAADGKAVLAQSALSEIAADNKLTAVEKKQLIVILADINKTDTEVRSNADKYSVSLTAYSAAYSALTSYINPKLTDMTATSTIDRAVFNARFDTLYLERSAINAAIVAKAEAATTAAQQAADAAQGAAEAAEGKAQEAKEDLSDIYSDGKVTPSEKQQIKTIWTEIVETDAEVRANADKYDVSLGTYPTAYTELESLVSGLLLDMNTTINVNRTTLDSRFEIYYRRRAAINRNIVSAAEQATSTNTAAVSSLTQWRGVASDGLNAIAGDITAMQGVIDGQKTSMEVISAIGNAETLKNKIAKARLDEDITDLNAQSVALQNAIDSYTSKIADLNAKRNAPKPPDMTQAKYNELRAEYAKQIADITAARTDLTAQKAVIADQVAQLADRKKLLDDFKEVEDGVRAQHTVKIDNDGKIVGFGLVLQKDGFSTFDVRADRFSISAPSGKPNDVNGNSPFMVLTNPQNINGVQVEAGTYMRNFYAPRGSIDTLQVADGAITTAKIGNLQVDTAQIANGAIETAKIGNLAVDTLQIADHAVTIPRNKSISGSFDTYVIEQEVEIELLTVSMDLYSGYSSISFGFTALGAKQGGNAFYADCKVIIRIKRGSEVLATHTLGRTGDYLLDGETRANIAHGAITYPFITDIVPPSAGIQTYTVTVQSVGLNLGSTSARFPVIIQNPSLLIIGTKK